MRHAGLDQFHGAPSPILIDASRPQLDEKTGYWRALADIYEATSGRFEFAEIDDFSNAVHERRYWQETEHQELARLEAMQERLSRFVHWDDDDGRYAGCPENVAYDAAQEACKAFEARIDAECVSRYSQRDAIFHEVFNKGYAPHKAPSHGNLLMVIDTFAATACDDTRPTVAKYVRNLKALQEQIAAQGGCLTIVFIDHSTKSEGTFQGSGSKFNDVDVVIEVHPKGQRRTQITCEKMKFFEPFAPMKFTMAPVTIDGHTDATGAPLTTLVCVGDTDAPDAAEAAPDAAEAAPKAAKPTASAMLLQLIQNHGAAISRSELRGMFYELPSQKAKAQPAKAAAFRRAIDDLSEECLIQVSEDDDIAATATK